MPEFLSLTCSVCCPHFFFANGANGARGKKTDWLVVVAVGTGRSSFFSFLFFSVHTTVGNVPFASEDAERKLDLRCRVPMSSQCKWTFPN